MNVLYAGYNNPISVSVPGIPENAVSMSMSGGRLISKGKGRYVAVPSAVGHDVTFRITARDGGMTRSSLHSPSVCVSSLIQLLI